MLHENIDTQLLIDTISNNPLITVAKGCPLMDFICHFQFFLVFVCISLERLHHSDGPPVVILIELMVVVI